MKRPVVVYNFVGVGWRHRVHNPGQFNPGGLQLFKSGNSAITGSGCGGGGGNFNFKVFET